MIKDVGLLILRLGVGLMMLSHGYGKLANLIHGKTGFLDPLGIGQIPSLILATFAEFFCALVVAAGFKTRWFAVPVAINMLVAALIVHSGDPWSRRELALLYAVPFLALVFTGGGRLGIDGLLHRGKRRT